LLCAGEHNLEKSKHKAENKTFYLEKAAFHSPQELCEIVNRRPWKVSP
jgi:hypothetical protein